MSIKLSKPSADNAAGPVNLKNSKLNFNSLLILFIWAAETQNVISHSEIGEESKTSWLWTVSQIVQWGHIRKRMLKWKNQGKLTSCHIKFDQYKRLYIFDLQVLFRALNSWTLMLPRLPRKSNFCVIFQTDCHHCHVRDIFVHCVPPFAQFYNIWDWCVYQHRSR